MYYLKELAKKIVFNHTPFGAPHYAYAIEPIQLAEIIKGIDFALADDFFDTNDAISANGGSDTKKAKGKIVEIGVARGMTSRFIAEHIITSNYDVEFYCLDTFSSFTPEDIDFEVETRGKQRNELAGFSYNNYETWKKNFSKFPFVKAIQCDASLFDFSSIQPISFCFLDVDLYLPTKKVLENIYPYLAPRAVIIVDDVLNDHRWDGAYQAFMEFSNEKKLPYEIAGNKCGIFRLNKQA